MFNLSGKRGYSWSGRAHERHARRIMNHAEKFRIRYGNLLLIVVGVSAGAWLALNPGVLSPIADSRELGYASSFVFGLLYPLTVTVSASIAGFFVLGKSLNPWFLALAGAAGSLVTNFLIFYFIRHRLLDHLDSFSRRFNLRIHVVAHKVNKHKVLRRIIPIFAGFVVGSPLPSEIAIGIFAAIKFEMKRFLVYAFVFNFASILLVSQFGKTF